MSAPRRKSTAFSIEALATGLSVIVVSTDFEEVARLCHRALVFSRGVIVAELSRRGALHRAVDSRGVGRRFERGIGGDAMASSIKSTALEPTRGDMARPRALPSASSASPRSTASSSWRSLLALLFSILLPDTFPTLLNVRSIISDKAIIAILSLGVDDPDGRGQDRPHGRLRHRALAHPRDQPADAIRHSRGRSRS